jgi:hypothetical protein
MTAAPSPELKARVLASVRATPSATRQRTQWATRGVVLGAAVLGAALYFAFGGLPHGEGRPPRLFLSSMSVWIASATVMLWAAVGKGRASQGRPRAWLLAVGAGAPVVIFLVMLAMATAGPASDPALIAALHRSSASCFVMTLAAAVPGVLALLYVRRRSDAVHPALHGAALGASFGAYAGVMVCFWCPDVAPLHIALGHVAPLVVLALLGGAVGRRVLAPA